MKERRPPRQTVVLSESTQRLLGMYALAASAAGVGVSALAQTAEAKIVYTTAHVELQDQQPVGLDFNHDGKADLFLLFGYARSVGGFATEFLIACHQPSCISTVSSQSNPLKAIWVNPTGSANALRAGKIIKQGDRFKNKVYVGLGHVNWWRSGSASTSWRGPWMNGGKGVKNRYLGVKFHSKGRVHFGWARLTVTTTPPHDFKATLTGYAYETVPGKAIIAGKTKGPDVITLPQDSKAGTLGYLALGRK